MLPTFSNNDYVITRRTSHLKKDDVVVINAENNNPVIKRVESLLNGGLQVSSDNKAYESEICNKQYNYHDILGKVIFKLSF
tara:strand:+ start:274 stop:516 length:243 start_codon:yes stop_codon:yes gene_type:complete